MFVPPSKGRIKYFLVAHVVDVRGPNITPPSAISLIHTHLIRQHEATASWRAAEPLFKDGARREQYQNAAGLEAVLESEVESSVFCVHSIHASTSFTTFPFTSVRRKSLPLYR